MNKLRSVCVLLSFAIVLMIWFGSASSVRAELYDNLDGTVSDDDRPTWDYHLMWHKASTDVPLDWQDAMIWADLSQVGGYVDWRLPSALHFQSGVPDTGFGSVMNEWGHLYGIEWDGLDFPTLPIDITPMTGYSCLWYWTETEDPLNPNFAYAFFMFEDNWFNMARLKTDTLCVSAVRNPGLETMIPPVAIIEEDQHWAYVNESIELDPSSSYDLDGTIVLYEWDCDGDGHFEQSSNTNATIECTWDEPGTHTVTLRVTDDDGLTDTATVTKTVYIEPSLVWPDGFPFDSWVVPTIWTILILVVLSLLVQVYTIRSFGRADEDETE